MATNWVLVAENSRARLFEMDSPRGALRELEALAHPEGRQKTGAFDSDRPGRAFDSRGEGRHAMVRSVDPRQQGAMDFARRIAERLEQGRTAGAFEGLVLVAPPSFLGMLRKCFGEPLRKKVVREINKDLVSLGDEEIARHVRALP